MAGTKKRRLVEINQGTVRLVVIDHDLDYGNRFTADIFSADGTYCGSLGSGRYYDDDPGAAMLGEVIDDVGGEARVEHFAAEYEQCILRALRKAGE
jgi:hypothetical protein